MVASMVTVAAARAAARKRVERDRRDWSVGDHAAAVLELPLHPPTERAVRAEPGAAQLWARSWRDEGAVRWVTRSWPSFGTQQVPERLILTGAEAIAAFAGRDMQRDWHRMRDAVAALRDRFGETEPFTAALLRSASTIADLPPIELERLQAMLGWLIDHPDSRLRLRQLPVRGVHTKWLEQHRGLVTRLHEALTGRASLGLTEKPVLIRVRVLDPALRPGGLEDLTLPLDELALITAPAEVLVVENLETLLALPSLPATIGIAGLGFGVGGRLRPIPWMRTARVRYWGDLDSQGFRILDDLRATLPTAASLLMDLPTLEAHRDLAVQEDQNTFGSSSRLTADELETLAALRAGGGLRIEQERLEWGWVLSRIESAR